MKADEKGFGESQSLSIGCHLTLAEAETTLTALLPVNALPGLTTSTDFVRAKRASNSWSFGFAALSAKRLAKADMVVRVRVYYPSPKLSAALRATLRQGWGFRDVCMCWLISRVSVSPPTICCSKQRGV